MTESTNSTAVGSSEMSRGAQPPTRKVPALRLVVFVCVWLGIPWLILGAALAPVLPGGWLAVGFGFALLALPVALLLRGFANAFYPGAWMRRLLFRPFWYAMLFVPPLAVVTLLGALGGLLWGDPGSGSRWALGAAATLLLLFTLLGYVGSKRLVIQHLDVALPRLPAAFDGLRVVQLSDLHVGPHTGRRYLRRVAQMVEQARPDLVAITGDQVDDFVPDVEIFNAAFQDLQAPLGVYVVAGNHDVYAGWEGVQRGLELAGFSVLVNHAVPLERRGERLWIAGTGDPAARSRLGAGGAAPDLQRTLREVTPDEPVITLAHNPALWPALADAGVDLTLSGHTHYGQFALPRFGWSLASPFLRHAMGWHRSDQSLLYINPGTNYWGLPLRLGTPPEVSVLTLRRADAGEARIERT